MKKKISAVFKKAYAHLKLKSRDRGRFFLKHYSEQTKVNFFFFFEPKGMKQIFLGHGTFFYFYFNEYPIV